MLETSTSSPKEQLPRNPDGAPEPVPPKKESYASALPARTDKGGEEELQKVSLAIDALEQAPSPVQEAVMNGLLQRSGIPSGAFEYTADLRIKLLQYGKTLTDDIALYQRLTDKEKRERQLQVMLDRTDTYTENLIQQFVIDNTDAAKKEERRKTYQKQRTERIHDTYKLNLLGAQMEIACSLAKKEGAKAYKRAEEYVRSTNMGMISGEKSDEKTQGMIRSFAKNFVQQTEQHVLPVLEKNVREFAKQSFIRSFWNRAKQTGNFALDWVSVRFSDDAKNRMAKSITPLVKVGPVTAVKKCAPIVIDFAKTAFNISLNHQEALALLASTAGAISFDLTLVVATWGVGTAVKGAHLTGNAAKVGGTATKGLSALSMGFGIGKTSLRPLYGASEKLSFAKLEEKAHKRLNKGEK